MQTSSIPKWLSVVFLAHSYFYLHYISSSTDIPFKASLWSTLQWIQTPECVLCKNNFVIINYYILLSKMWRRCEFWKKPDVAETCSITCIGVFPFRLQLNWLWVLRPAEMLRFESLNRYENLTFTICKIKLSVISGVTIHVIASQFLSLLKPKLYLWNFCTAISHYLYWYICKELRLVDIWPRTMYWSGSSTNSRN